MESFQITAESYWNVTDLVSSVVTSSKLLGWPQKRPNDRTLNAGVVV